MNRSTVFTSLGAAALALIVIAGGGVAFAVVQGQNPPNDAATPPATRAAGSPAPTLTPDPGATAVPGSLPAAERLRPWRPGDHLVTEQQLRDFHASKSVVNQPGPSFERLMETNLYAVDCMKKAGFYWDPRTDPKYGQAVNDYRTVDPAALTALRGQAGQTTDWHLQGCDGIGAHLAGLDGTDGVPGTIFPGYAGPGPNG